jgi:hypothetical protein
MYIYIYIYIYIYTPFFRGMKQAARYGGKGRQFFGGKKGGAGGGGFATPTALKDMKALYR